MMIKELACCIFLLFPSIQPEVEPGKERDQVIISGGELKMSFEKVGGSRFENVNGKFNASIHDKNGLVFEVISVSDELVKCGADLRNTRKSKVYNAILIDSRNNITYRLKEKSSSGLRFTCEKKDTDIRLDFKGWLCHEKKDIYIKARLSGRVPVKRSLKVN